MGCFSLSSYAYWWHGSYITVLESFRRDDVALDFVLPGPHGEAGGEGSLPRHRDSPFPLHRGTPCPINLLINVIIPVSSHASWSQKGTFAFENLHHLSPTLPMAEKVGILLGRSHHVQQELQSSTSPTTSARTARSSERDPDPPVPIDGTLGLHRPQPRTLSR